MSRLGWILGAAAVGVVGVFAAAELACPEEVGPRVYASRYASGPEARAREWIREAQKWERTAAKLRADGNESAAENAEHRAREARERAHTERYGSVGGAEGGRFGVGY